MKPLLLAILLIPLSALHAAEQKHPIDVEMEEALANASSTADMVRAPAKAGKQWDREMNRIYAELKKSMKPGEWKALATAQRAWVAFRDAQIKALGTFYKNMDGTMWIPVAASDVMEVTRKRALFLQGMLDVIQMR